MATCLRSCCPCCECLWNMCCPLAPSRDQTDSARPNQSSSTAPLPMIIANTQPTFKPLPLYVALYDYDGRTNEDLSFKEGELLEVTDKTNPDWWYAQKKTASTSNARSNTRGYIPANYVAEFQSLNAEPFEIPKTGVSKRSSGWIASEDHYPFYVEIREGTEPSIPTTTSGFLK